MARTARRSPSAARRTSASASTRRRPSFSSLTLVEGDVAGRERGRGRQGAPPAKKDLEGRRHDRRPGRGPGRADADLRARPLRRRGEHRRRDARGLRPTDRAAALRQGRQARPDPRGARSRASPRSSWSTQIRADPPARDAGADRRGAGGARTRRTRTSFLSFLQNFLLAFGGIALFVGTFVIANSLSITIAQRTREFATLRTIGASRRQVLRVDHRRGARRRRARLDRRRSSRGLALAVGLFKLFDAVGFTLPEQRARAPRRARSSCRCSSGSSSRCSRASARRSARRACRRSQPCARARRCRRAASRRYRHRRLGRPDRCSASLRWPTASSARASARPRSCSGWASAPCSIFVGRRAPVGAARAGRSRTGSAGRPPARRRGGRARARQRATQPAAHRVDRVGADDRARARDARGRARRRDHEELPRRGRRALERRLRDHGAERLLADPASAPRTPRRRCRA